MNEELRENGKDDEISLIDLFAVLWQRKIMIVVIVVLAMIGVVVYSVLSLALPPEKSFLPNKYTPKALMLINNDGSSGGSIAAMLSSNSSLSSLAGLMGVRASGSTYSSLAIYLTGTNSMLDAITDEFDIITRYKIKKSPRASSRKILKKLLKAETDTKSGVLSIGFTDIDPVFAQSVVNYSVNYLEKRFDEMGLDKNKLEKENLERNIENTYNEIINLEQELRRLGQAAALGSVSSVSLEVSRLQLEVNAQRQVYTQLKIQYEVLKVTMASEKPVFQVLEYAEVPDKKSGPNRGNMCIIVTFAAGFFAVFLAFALNAIENIKKDPEAMAKLKGNKE
jgi:uncharacterized protein involved in exopolysaccharide biosynthesis